MMMMEKTKKKKRRRKKMPSEPSFSFCVYTSTHAPRADDRVFFYATAS